VLGNKVVVQVSWVFLSLIIAGGHRRALDVQCPAFLVLAPPPLHGGLQIGVEAVDLVMIIQNENVYKSCFRVISKLERTLQQQRVQLDGIPRPYGLELDTEIRTYSPAMQLGIAARVRHCLPGRGQPRCARQQR
jgi:hypothetical protein